MVPSMPHGALLQLALERAHGAAVIMWSERSVYSSAFRIAEQVLPLFAARDQTHITFVASRYALDLREQGKWPALLAVPHTANDVGAAAWPTTAAPILSTLALRRELFISRTLQFETALWQADDVVRRLLDECERVPKCNVAVVGADGHVDETLVHLPDEAAAPLWRLFDEHLPADRVQHASRSSNDVHDDLRGHLSGSFDTSQTQTSNVGPAPPLNEPSQAESAFRNIITQHYSVNGGNKMQSSSKISNLRLRAAATAPLVMSLWTSFDDADVAPEPEHSAHFRMVSSFSEATSMATYPAWLSLSEVQYHALRAYALVSALVVAAKVPDVDDKVDSLVRSIRRLLYEQDYPRIETVVVDEGESCLARKARVLQQLPELLDERGLPNALEGTRAWRRDTSSDSQSHVVATATANVVNVHRERYVRYLCILPIAATNNSPSGGEQDVEVDEAAPLSRAADGHLHRKNDDDSHFLSNISSNRDIVEVLTPVGTERLSIGEMRNLAMSHASGAVVIFFEPGEWYGAARISAQVAPIFSGLSDITLIEHEYCLSLESRPPPLFRLREMGAWGPSFSTIALRHALYSVGNVAFPPVSLGEDVGFVDRCLRMRQQTLQCRMQIMKATPLDELDRQIITTDKHKAVEVAGPIYIHIRRPSMNGAWQMDEIGVGDDAAWDTTSSAVTTVNGYGFSTEATNSNNYEGIKTHNEVSKTSIILVLIR